MSGPISVSDLAVELGLTPDDVLDRLRGFADPPPHDETAIVEETLASRIRQSVVTMTADQVDESPAHSFAEPQDGRQLILAAYGQALERGVPNWRRMQAGALKNRMLNITERQFDERKWGTSSFLTFLGLFPTLVSVDRSVAPPAVDLIGVEDEDPARALHATGLAPASAPNHSPGIGPAPTGNWKIRPDLWSAVLDYSNDGVWVWDGTKAVTIDSDQVEEQLAVLPTVSEQVLQGWREQFETVQATERPELVDDLHRWRTDAGSGWTLPPPVRYRWFEALKLHVRDRLVEWFDEHELIAPSDLVQTPARATRRTYRGGDAGTEQLRALVVECVESMTREELEELRLPPITLLRARASR